MRITCPSCGKSGVAPDSSAGRRIKCPSCGERFEANASAAIVQIDLATLVPEPDPIPEIALATVQAEPSIAATTKPCPYCAEIIQAQAIKCRYCSEYLEQPRTQSTPQVNRFPDYDDVQAQMFAQGFATPKPAPQQIIQQNVVVHQAGYQVPHILHFLLSILTCGLWIPIWILHAVLNPSQQR